jgi:flagellar hook-associated protein 2
MAALTSTGIGSGLDIESLVSQLVAAERAPADGRLTRQESKLTAELSAFGIFKGALATFQGSLSGLNNLSKFGQYTATSSNSDAVSVSASSGAASGSYDVEVTELAKAHSLASTSFASTSDVVGTGTLTFRFGTTDYTSPTPGPESYNSFALNADRGVGTVTIDSSNNTLEGMRSAINAADIGVSAAIVNDGTGYRLLLNSDQTGVDNSIEISVDDTGDSNNLNTSGLSVLAFNSGASNAEQTVAARNAAFSINGLSITSSGNSVDDVIDGVDLTLKDLTGVAPVTVTVAQDRTSVEEAVNGLVSGYNNFIEIANALTAYNAETGEASALQGDFSARSITSQVRQALTGSVTGFNGTFASLSEIGITTQADGTLSVDSAALDNALENSFDEMVGLFAQVGLPTDGDISFVSASDGTAVNRYAVNISQLATQGQLVGGVAAFPLTIDADNKNFTLSINGTSSASISLTEGNYASGTSLATEIQSRINGDSTLAAAGISVAVVYDVDHFEITSSQYGSDSSVAITAVGVNSSAELGFSVSLGTDGLNVAGTIGGLSATGAGQVLTGAADSGARGLQLLIGGGTTGARGLVDFSRGVAFQLNSLVDSFLESGGVLNSRTDSIQTRVDGILDQREVHNARIDALEIRYRAQFNALDGLLAQLQSTGDFLTQQLDSLPGSGSLLNR